MNPQLHKVATGQNKIQILSNARRLGQLKVPVVIRVPLIP